MEVSLCGTLFLWKSLLGVATQQTDRLAFDEFLVVSNSFLASPDGICVDLAFVQRFLNFCIFGSVLQPSVSLISDADFFLTLSDIRLVIAQTCLSLETWND